MVRSTPCAPSYISAHGYALWTRKTYINVKWFNSVLNVNDISVAQNVLIKLSFGTGFSLNSKTIYIYMVTRTHNEKSNLS